MSGPSNETEAEQMMRRQVEALEAIADHLETLAGAVEHIETLASVVEPERRAWSDPDGWANPVAARAAHLRTDVT